MFRDTEKKLKGYSNKKPESLFPNSGYYMGVYHVKFIPGNKCRICPL